jgi:Carboxypeptidase regulatory-like domain
MRNLIFALVFVAAAVAVGGIFYPGSVSSPMSDGELARGGGTESRLPVLAEVDEASLGDGLMPNRRSELKDEIQVSVQNVAGLPIENARVFIAPMGELKIRRGFRTCPRSLLKSSGSLVQKTDADGITRVAFPSPVEQNEQYLLVVDAPKFVALGRMVNSTEKERSQLQEFELHPAFRGKIQVVSPSGRVLEGAQVRLTLKASPRPDSFVYAEGSTASDGLVSFDNLQAGPYAWEVQREGYVTSRDTGIRVDSDHLTFEETITLQPAATFTGSVRSASGERVVGAKVSAVPTRQGIPQWLDLRYSADFVLTDSDGEFAISGLRRDHSYTLVATRQSIWTASEPGNPPSRVELQLPTTQLVRTRVLNSAMLPVDGAKVAFLDTRCPWAVQVIAMEGTDADGLMEIELSDGRYAVAVIHEAGDYLFPNPMEILGATDLGDLLLPSTGVVVFRGVDRGSKELIEDFKIRLIQKRSAGLAAKDSWKAFWDEFKPQHSNRKRLPGAAEAHTIQGLASGLHKFKATAPGYTATEIKVEVESDKKLEVEVLMTPASELRVLVVDPAGLPVVGQKFSLMASGSRSRRTPRGFATDEQGIVRFHQLNPGKYEFRYDTSADTQLNLAEFEVELGQNEGQAVLNLVRGVRVHVSEAGQECVNYPVFLYYPYPFVQESRPIGMRPASGTLHTADDGMAEVPSVLAGDYIIGVQSASGRSLRTPCTLQTSGQVVEIRFEAGVSLSGQVLPPLGGIKVHMVQNQGMESLELWAKRRGAKDWLQNQGVPAGQMGYSGNGFTTKLTSITDPDGNFAFPGLSPGDCHLFAYAGNGLCSGVVTVEIGPSDVAGVQLPLVLSATLRVKFSNIKIALEEHGYQGISARLLVEGEERLFAAKTLGGDPGGLAEFIDSGEVEFKYLMPGKFTLQIRGWSRESKTEVLPLLEIPFELQVGEVKHFIWDGQTPAVLH